MSLNEEQNRELDKAVAGRLSKLAATPVDTSRLDAALRSQIPRRRSGIIYRLTRPAAAIAASITLLLAIAAAVLLSSPGGEVLASPAQMAQVHRDIVANRVPVTRVSSIEEAGRVLSQSGSQSPQLPQAPQEHVMACCMKSIRDKRVACVLMQDPAGTPITMTVAHSADMQLPRGPTVTRNGVTYHIQSSGALNMVMTERAGRWICLIAELPQEKLIDLAERLRF